MGGMGSKDGDSREQDEQAENLDGSSHVIYYNEDRTVREGSVNERVSGGSSTMRITMEEFIRRGQAIYGKEDFHGVENIIELGEQRWGKNFGQKGFMHQTDHQAALRVILGREPTWMEVQDSWSRGAANIWKARKLVSPGPDPSWPPETRRLYDLMEKWGPEKGQRIFDGKEPDPDAGKPPTSKPTDPTPKPTDPTPPVTPADLSPAPQRAEELATLIRPVYEKFAESPPWFAQWMFPSWEKLWPALKPLVVEAVLSARRAAARRQ